MVVMGGDRLLPAPFCEFLEREIRTSGSIGAADRLSLADRRIRCYLGDPLKGESGLPTVAVVDRVLTASGESIAAMYGSLYELVSLCESTETHNRINRCLKCGDRLREPAPYCGFCEAER